MSNDDTVYLGEPVPDDAEIVEQMPAVPEGPQPEVAGTFAIYRTPDGGFMLIVDRGAGIEKRHIPGGMVRMFARSPLARRFKA